MSNFLNNLNKNAKTEDEYAIQKNRDEILREKQREYRQQQEFNQLKTNFDNLMAEFFQDIQELCVEAVSEACYITYNGKRYLLCRIALMEYYGFDNDYDRVRNCWMQFNCYKLEKNHILESKRIRKGKQCCKTFSYFNRSDVDPEILGCQSTGTSYRQPSYMNLELDANTYLDGYTKINTLPPKIINLNFPPTPIQGGFKYTRPITEHRFLIEF